jgi:hypothetical protein
MVSQTISIFSFFTIFDLNYTDENYLTMNKIMFIKIFLLTIVFIILGIDLFTDYTLNKWIKSIGFLFLSILALIDLIKKKD